MKIVINNGKQFFKELAFIASVVETGTINFKKDAITIQETDSSCVSLIIYKNTDFEIVEPFDKPISVGVKFKDLICDPKGNLLEISIENNIMKFKIGKSEYTYENIDISSQQLNAIDINYSVTFQIDYKEFKKLYTAVKKISDTMEFEVNENEIAMSANNGKQSFKETYEYTNGTNEVESFKVSFPVSSLKGMKDICKEICISISESTPIKLEFGTLTLYIAPKAND